jgi:hypothetical protein
MRARQVGRPDGGRKPEVRGIGQRSASASSVKGMIDSTGPKTSSFGNVDVRR